MESPNTSALSQDDEERENLQQHDLAVRILEFKTLNSMHEVNTLKEEKKNLQHQNQDLVRDCNMFKEKITRLENQLMDDTGQTSDIAPDRQDRTAIRLRCIAFLLKFLGGLGIVFLLFMALRIYQRSSVDGCLDVKEMLEICSGQLDDISAILSGRNLKITDLETENKVVLEKLSSLETSKQNLELRLSEMIWANAKPDNIEFTKLEDYSPMKIAESYRETYDNEYTLAMEECGDKEPAEYFLEILKIAYNLCTTYSAKHLNAIKSSIANIQVQLPPDHERQKYSKSDIPTLKEDAMMKDALKVMLDKPFSTSEWNEILDLRITAAHKLQEPMTEALLQVIINYFDIKASKQPKLVAFAKKCLRLCWMMNLNLKPVYIKFIETSDRTFFDADMFRPYLKAGKYFDYVVWPPLFMHEGGRMLAKGIAEGKN